MQAMCTSAMSEIEYYMMQAMCTSTISEIE